MEIVIRSPFRPRARLRRWAQMSISCATGDTLMYNQNGVDAVRISSTSSDQFQSIVTRVIDQVGNIFVKLQLVVF